MQLEASEGSAGKPEMLLDEEQGDRSVEDMLNELLSGEGDGVHDEGVQTEENTGAARKRADGFRRPAARDSYRQLDMLQLGIRQRIQAHRSQIRSLNAQIAAAQSLDRMSQAQERITELFIHIHHLRAGATESEIIVREITRDIKNLDLAKKNIVSSITGVKRFQMLVVAFDQLSKQAKARRYKESAEALRVSLYRTRLWEKHLSDVFENRKAVKELADHFRSFGSIERIASVLKEIQEIQGFMRSQVMKDFEIASGAVIIHRQSRKLTSCYTRLGLGKEEMRRFRQMLKASAYLS